MLFLDEHRTWTGFLTTRPAFKFFERQSNAILLAASQVNAAMETSNKEVIGELQRAVSLVQHHDAITGTNYGPVDIDYRKRLWYFFFISVICF